MIGSSIAWPLLKELGFINFFKLLHENDIDTCQIVSGDPADLKDRHISDKLAKKMRKYIKKFNLQVFIHSKFTINLAKQNDQNKYIIKQVIIKDLMICDKIGALGIVVHVGQKSKKYEINEKDARINMTKNIIYALTQMMDNNISSNLLIETGANRHQEFCTKMEDLYATCYKYVIAKAKDKTTKKYFKNHLGFVIDTAHIFNAGYDIRGHKAMKRYLNFIDNISYDNLKSLGSLVKCIHLNDTPRYLSESGKDRHENLLKGHALTTESISMIIKWAKNIDAKIVLETPDKNIDQCVHYLEILVSKFLGSL